MVCIAMEETGFALLTLFFSGVFLIILSSIIYAQIKKKNRKKVRDKRNEQSQPKNLKSNSQESTIFKDLNENNRIENTLFNIWNRYKDSVDSQIINRKPIFSADAVKDSILFIGINPSFNPSDDNYFIKSDDGNSLLYGSFYQRSDAPEYFKILEIFASKLNRGYTHINLLYARENNRELLLNCDHNFIREQLELTYETILKIKPVAIFFFSDYCKNLIFGADRWVNPNSESNGSYILNGTNFPVFLTDDITSMTAIEQIELINKMKEVI